MTRVEAGVIGGLLTAIVIVLLFAALLAWT